MKYSQGHLNEVSCRFQNTIVVIERTLVWCGPDQESNVLKSSGQHCHRRNCACNVGALTQICVQHHNSIADCSAPGTLCPPCSFFAPAGVIAADLPHDLKPLRSHLSTSERLFAIVNPSISCPGSRNEVPVKANKT